MMKRKKRQSAGGLPGAPALQTEPQIEPAIPPRAAVARVDDLLVRWCEERAVSREALVGTSRRHRLCEERAAFAGWVREHYPRYSLQDIGDALGGRCHTTILSILRLDRKRKDAPCDSGGLSGEDRRSSPRRKHPTGARR